MPKKIRPPNPYLSSGCSDSVMDDQLANDANPTSFADLLDRARRGEREAFAHLYEATHRRIFGYLLARLGERGVAEDSLQDVYLAGLERIRQFRGRNEGQFMAWLLAISRAKLADRVRRRYRHPETLAADVEGRETADPVDELVGQERVRQLAAALARLSPDQRDVVLARLVMEMDLAETAVLMRKKVGAIKALQHRGLARLARLLAERAGAEFE